MVGAVGRSVLEVTLKAHAEKSRGNCAIDRFHRPFYKKIDFLMPHGRLSLVADLDGVTVT